MTRLAAALAACLAVGCQDTIDAGGQTADAGPDDDPLAVTDQPAAGSWDEIHRSIIRPGCAGQPGLCHAGQFEPNLSTPANAYAYLVNRPGTEHPDQRRVKPGDPGDSLLIDKLRNRNVFTQMPLGAEPLPEAEIALIEAWIEDGALRSPDADPPPLLNELPQTPELAVFSGATRIDGPATTDVTVGQTLTFRISVRDFETADAAIPIAVFVLGAPDGRNIVLTAAQMDPHVVLASYDPAGPMGTGDLLNWKFDWTVPATVSLRDDATGAITPNISTAGMTISAFAVYLDSTAADGMTAFGIRPNVIQVQ